MVVQMRDDGGLDGNPASEDAVIWVDTGII